MPYYNLLVRTPQENQAETPVLLFQRQDHWASWLSDNCGFTSGVWLRLAKKKSAVLSLSYLEALETALCFGWIDGQKKKGDDDTWLQKFTPRRKKSLWSKINQEKALALMECGKMQPLGLEEINRAKEDGRWDTAYDPPSRATVPPDLQAALQANQRAQSFFATLNSANRYAIIWRVQTTKKTETRTKRIRQLVEMLERNEKLHP